MGPADKPPLPAVCGAAVASLVPPRGARGRSGAPTARRRTRPMCAATMPECDGVCTDPV